MAMKLTAYEQEMLDGKHGEAKQLAMKIMLKVGEPLGAEEFVEVVSVQAMAHFGSLHIDRKITNTYTSVFREILPITGGDSKGRRFRR